MYLTDIRDGQGSEASERLGRSATYRHLDIREEEDWQYVSANVIEQRAQLDILVNNGGILAGFAARPATK